MPRALVSALESTSSCHELHVESNARRPECSDVSDPRWCRAAVRSHPLSVTNEEGEEHCAAPADAIRRTSRVRSLQPRECRPGVRGDLSHVHVCQLTDNMLMTHPAYRDMQDERLGAVIRVVLGVRTDDSHWSGLGCSNRWCIVQSIKRSASEGLPKCQTQTTRE
jgi:hypothetical protein